MCDVLVRGGELPRRNGRVVQRQNQRASWFRTVEVLREDSRAEPMALFVEDREAPELACEMSGEGRRAGWWLPFSTIQLAAILGQQPSRVGCVGTVRAADAVGGVRDVSPVLISVCSRTTRIA